MRRLLIPFFSTKGKGWALVWWRLVELSTAVGEEWRRKVRREGVLPLLSILPLSFLRLKSGIPVD
jgi:hypothetical protein